MAEETSTRTHPTGEHDAQVHQYLNAHKKPAHPDFIDYEKRLESFNFWLPGLNQTAEEMAAMSDSKPEGPSMPSASSTLSPNLSRYEDNLTKAICLQPDAYKRGDVSLGDSLSPTIAMLLEASTERAKALKRNSSTSSEPNSTPGTSKSFVVERPLDSAIFVFNELNYKYNNLKKVEYFLLQDLYKTLTATLPQLKPDFYIYLKTEPEVCFTRIRNRGLPEERYTTLNFLDQISELNNRWLENQTNVFIITNNTDKELENCLNVIKSKI
ncbi:unnamed protein product [Bemisia tabaci]|uniref:Deoxynucleoside kinase domain-containing protein n=1 Tax=Bemisia tabaci TaxID=7038 RepID=A0A9P0APD4_BEMTA|nr:unnamed protein product [Bemisia tabaci]